MRARALEPFIGPSARRPTQTKGCLRVRNLELQNYSELLLHQMELEVDCTEYVWNDI